MLLLVDDKVHYTRTTERLNIAVSGKKFTCSFIEPGLVNYADSGGGMELLTKEAIDDGLATFLGNPLTIGHIDRQRLNDRGVVQGRIESAKWNPGSGWYDCTGTVDTEQARTLIKNGGRPSCGYTVLEYGPGGMYHNIPYDAEIKRIKFHHLAIVDNPRYEGADIRLNSKGNTTMPKFKLFKTIRELLAGQTEPTVRVEEIALDENTEVQIDGKAVKLNSLAAAMKASDDAEAKKIEDAKKLEAQKANAVHEDDEVEIDGKRVKMNALVTCYRQYGQKDNEKSGNDENAEEAKAERERANALEKENAAKAEKEAAAKAAADKLATEKANAGKQSFALLAGARDLPPPAATAERINSGTLAEGVALGKSRYGSAPASGKN